MMKDGRRINLCWSELVTETFLLEETVMATGALTAVAVVLWAATVALAVAWTHFDDDGVGLVWF
jgi:hypothetical protein